MPPIPLPLPRTLCAVVSAQNRTYLLPNFPEAHWPWEQRVGDDVELVAMPQPPLAGVSDLHRRRLHVLLLPAPPGKPAACVVPEAQPNLETDRCARHNQGRTTQSNRLELKTHDYDVPTRSRRQRQTHATPGYRVLSHAMLPLREALRCWVAHVIMLTLFRCTMLPWVTRGAQMLHFERDAEP